MVRGDRAQALLCCCDTTVQVAMVAWTGQCGSCWTFSASELVSLSEQQLVVATPQLQTIPCLLTWCPRAKDVIRDKVVKVIVSDRITVSPFSMASSTISSASVCVEPVSPLGDARVRTLGLADDGSGTPSRPRDSAALARLHPLLDQLKARGP